MKQLLNTLYITMPETYLACSGNDIVFSLFWKRYRSYVGPEVYCKTANAKF